MNVEEKKITAGKTVPSSSINNFWNYNTGVLSETISEIKQGFLRLEEAR